MTAAKRKVSVTLDADLVAELGLADEALSRQVNDAVRDALERRRRQRLLAELCAELEVRHGPVSKKLLAKYEALLA
ncbi:MAG: type II toxin-antitoxin system CcdA family antitoxin [Myxococcales bacterium]|nr:type II toxin-antitoxin system CcdA family antitoxin [Myxococcales bacterium]